MISQYLSCADAYFSEFAHCLPDLPIRHEMLMVEQVADASVKAIESMSYQFSRNGSVKKEIVVQLIEMLFNRYTNNLPPSTKGVIDRLRKLIEIKKDSWEETLPLRGVCQLVRQVYFEWFDQCFTEEWGSIKKGTFAFSQKDYDHIQTKFSEKRLDDYLMCHDFAFYKLNEQWAEEFLFNGEEIIVPQQLFCDPCQFLIDKGYVLTNGPVEGDLVVYCKPNEGTFFPHHFGIWTKDGKVLSKFGSLSVYEHNMENVDIFFGKRVFFFHKRITSSLQADLLVAIKDSRAWCVSPLTPKGAGNIILKHLMELKVHSYYLNSLYNREYGEEVRQKLGERLTQLVDSEECELVSDLLDRMEQITLSISTEVKPRLY